MTTVAYFEGSIVPIEQAKVSIMTHTFNYGTGCFGGLRGYWNEERETLYVFRILDHYRRFLNSAKYLLAQVDHTPQQLADITVELLSREGWRENCYIRPLLYKADETIGVRLHNLRDALAIFSLPLGQYLPQEEGAKVCTSSWRRVDDTVIPARGKLIGSYMNSSLIKSEAVLNGFSDAIVLNQDGHVSEGSAANFFMVRDDVLITPPVYGNVLEGIIRRTILHLAQQELGLPVKERTIDRSEVYIADEAFFCGTGVQFVTIGSVDHRQIGDGGTGPISRQVRDLFLRVLYGREPKYMHWLTPIPQAELAR
jgi:branched-chain amino acid aminotransferase